MAAKATEYRSVSFAVWKAPVRRLRVSAEGIRYSGPDQKIDVGWRDVRALVAAGIPIESEGEPEVVPALGIALHVPFASPTLVGQPSPALDYAVPLGDLARIPFLGMSNSAEEIFERVADYARAAGVKVIEASDSA